MLSLELNSHPKPSGEADSPPAPAMPAPLVTLGTLAANILVFFAMTLSGVPFIAPNGQQVLPWGADFGPLTTSGQWWRLLTACFVHFGFLHVAMNMFCLLQVGVLTERLFGSVRFLLLYLLAGISGNIVGLYLHPLTVSAGASGAVFGVYGSLLAFLLFRRGVVPTERAIGVARFAAMFVVFNLIYSLGSTSTDIEAHLGGLFVGFGAGCLLAWSLAPATQSLRTIRTLGIALVMVLVLFVAFARVPRSIPSQTEWYRQIMTDPRITVGSNDQVAYGGTATKADAEALGKMLVRIGMFRKPRVTVLFERGPDAATISIPYEADESQYKIDPSLPPMVDNVTSNLVDGKTIIIHKMEKRLPIKKGPLPWYDPAVISSIKTIGPQLASAAGGTPLTIRLLNAKGDWRNEVKIEDATVLIGTLDVVEYSGQPSMQDARALGDSLRSAGFFQDRGMTVRLNKSGSSPELSFYLEDSGWDNPRIVKGYEILGRKIAPIVGGPPLTIHLIDNVREAKKDLVIDQ